MVPRSGNKALVQSEKRKGEQGDVLPASSLSHDPQLILLVVDVLGQVAVLSDAPDLGVVLELLLQLLAVVDGRLLSGGKLRQNRAGEFTLLHLQNILLGIRISSLSIGSFEANPPFWTNL